MSDIGDEIKFRKLVISFAEDLSAEEIHKVAYAWLPHRGEVGTYSPHYPNRASGIELFSRLECLGVFSSRNVSGLADIAKTMNRPDLVEKVKEFSRKGKTATKSSKSQQNQELQNVLGDMVDQVTVLVQHINLLQKTMSTSESDMDEGIEIIGGSSAIANELAKSLSQAHMGLKLRSRRTSSESSSSDDSTNAEISRTVRGSVEYAPSQQPEKRTKPKSEEKLMGVTPASPDLSSSSSSSSLELSTGPEPTPTTLSAGEQERREGRRNRDKPFPKPRRPKTPPPYRPPAQESAQAVQESTIYTSPMLRASSSHDLPPPIPPKRQNSPMLKRATPKPSSTSKMCYTKPAVCVQVQRKESDERIELAVEECDPGGDSGLESGSGSVQHGTITEWREAITNPPPEPKPQHSGYEYTTINIETKDEERVYALPREELDPKH